MCTYKVVKMVSLTFLLAYLPFSMYVSFVCVKNNKIKEKSDKVIIDIHSVTKLEIWRQTN